MEQNIRRYDAFISYRHLAPDMAIAMRLQKLLERHKNSDGKNLTVFLDQTELPLSSDLGNDIHIALENSRFLIIIASRAYKQSRWCMAELEYFRELHGGSNRNILLLMVDGEPDEVFPEVLLHEPVTVTADDGYALTRMTDVEPLAGDVRGKRISQQFRKLRTEYLRIAAPILGKSFDDLFQRAARRKRHQVIAIASFVVTLAVAFSVYSLYMLNQIQQRQDALYANESRRLANTSMSLLRTDPGLALLLADTALPGNLDSPDYPLMREAEYAIRSAALHANILKQSQGVRMTSTIKLQSTPTLFYGDGRYFVTEDTNHTWVYDALTGSLLRTIDDSGLVFSADATRYYKKNSLYEDGDYRIVVDVFDTFTGALLASHEVQRDLNGNVYSSHYDDRTDRFYFYRHHRYTHEITLDGYINAQNEFVPSSQAADDASVFLDEDQRAGQVLENRIFVDDPLLKAGFTELYGSEYTIGDITRTHDGSLFFIPLYGEKATYFHMDPDEVMFVFNGDEEKIAFTIAEEAYTVLWDPVNHKEIAKLHGFCFQMVDNHLFYNIKNGTLRTYAYYPGYFSSIQSDPEEYNIPQTGDPQVAKDGHFFYPRYQLLSRDRNRVARTSSTLEGTELAFLDDTLVEVFSVDALNQPLLSVVCQGYYTFSANLDYLLAEMQNVAKGRWVELHSTNANGCMLELPLPTAASAYSFCVNEDGTLVAIAMRNADSYRSWTVDVVDVASAEVVQQYNITTQSSYEPYMELSGSQLLVAFDTGVWLVGLDNPVDIRSFQVSPEIASAFETIFAFPTAFQENGMLIVPGSEDSAYGTRFRVNSIIDLESGQSFPFYSRYDAGIESYFYDPVTDTLIDQETNEFWILRRNAGDRYEKAFRITAQEPCHQLDFYLSACDGEYLVINGMTQTEIYTIADGELAFVLPYGDLHTPYFAIYDGVLYDMNSSSDQIERYALPDTKLSQEWVREYLVESGVQKTLTDEECDTYYIPDEWQP